MPEKRGGHFDMQALTEANFRVHVRPRAERVHRTKPDARSSNPLALGAEQRGVDRGEADGLRMIAKDEQGKKKEDVLVVPLPFSPPTVLLDDTDIDMKSVLAQLPWRDVPTGDTHKHTHTHTHTHTHKHTHTHTHTHTNTHIEGDI
jgi:ABC-type nickel/cobalt efflux system permease component RcnA